MNLKKLRKLELSFSFFLFHNAADFFIFFMYINKLWRELSTIFKSQFRIQNIEFYIYDDIVSHNESSLSFYNSNINLRANEWCLSYRIHTQSILPHLLFKKEIPIHAAICESFDRGRRIHVCILETYIPARANRLSERGSNFPQRACITAEKE